MKHSLLSIYEQLKEDLFNRSLVRLEQGLEYFYSEKEDIDLKILDSLSDAVQSMLHSLVIRIFPVFLLPDAPLPLKAALSDLSNVPSDLGSYVYDSHIRQGRYKLISFDDAVALFFYKYKGLKQQWFPYFMMVSRILKMDESRRKQVDESIINKSAYFALELMDILRKKRIFDTYAYKRTGRDRQFIEQFNIERAKEVERALEQARVFTREGQRQVLYTPTDHWEIYTTACSICGEKAMDFYGFTDLQKNNKTHLIFYAHSAQCKNCGLTLVDSTELLLAGMRNVYNRTGELNEWLEEQGFHKSFTTVND